MFDVLISQLLKDRGYDIHISTNSLLSCLFLTHFAVCIRIGESAFQRKFSEQMCLAIGEQIYLQKLKYLIKLFNIQLVLV